MISFSYYGKGKFSIAACGRHVSTAVSFSIGSIENGDQSKTIAAGTTEKVMVAEGATPTFTFVPDTETAEFRQTVL